MYYYVLQYYRFFNIWNKLLNCTYLHLSLFHSNVSNIQQKAHHTLMYTHQCFKHKNIIRLECRNWIRDEVVWWWRKRTNWKFAFGKQNIGIGHNEKQNKKLCNFVNMCYAEKFKLLTPSQKFGSLFFQVLKSLRVSNLESCSMMIFHKMVTIFA